MAKGKYTGGKKFGTDQPVPVSPGRPKQDPEIREIKKLTRTAFEELVYKFTGMPLADLKKRLTNPETTTLELMVGMVIKEGIVRGDQQRLNFILDRTFGKVKEQIEHSGEDGGPIKLIVEDLRVIKKEGK